MTEHPDRPAFPVVVLVGQNPGAQEDNANRPFIGPSGKLVREVYCAPLLDRAHIYLTNACRCTTPPEVDPPKPSFRACLPYTLDDLASICRHHPTSPVYLVALGAHAARHLHRALGPKELSLRDALNHQGTPCTLPGDNPPPNRINLFATYHPAYILRDRKFIYAVDRHLKLLCRHIDGTAPTPSDPSTFAPRRPTPTDSVVASIDIETYGLYTNDHDDTPLPPQTVFHVQRSLYTDGVHPSRLVRTVSITLAPRAIPCTSESATATPSSPSPESPRSSSSLPTSTFSSGPRTSPSSGSEPPGKNNGISSAPSSTSSVPTASNSSSFPDLTPGDTFVFHLWKPDHQLLLRSWFKHLKHLFLMNCVFDITYLRALGYRIDRTTHFITDLQHLIYLWDETCTERSLKSIGQVLGTHVYAPKQTFPKPGPEADAYNAQDTHNTLSSCAAIAANILQRYPSTAKLSPSCLSFYNDIVWVVVSMSESGLTYSIPRLQSLESRLSLHITKLESILDTTFSIKMAGKGSQLSKEAFFEDCLSILSLTDNPRVRRTDKTHKPSFDEANRNFVSDVARERFALGELSTPVYTRLRHAFSLITRHTFYRKLLSTYVTPLLHHRANKPDDRRSVLLPTPNPSIGIAHHTWYITPSPEKDTGGDEGGTKQGRIVCKHPAEQTSPPQIQACRTPRSPSNSLLAIDLDQIELKVAAILSGDQGMLTEYRKPKPDIHSDMAIRLFGPSIVDHPHWRDGTPDDPRQWGKVPNFLILYRGGADKLQSSTLENANKLLPMDFCKSVVAKFPIERPGLWQWQRALIREAVGTWTWTSTLGRTFTDWVEGDAPPWEVLSSPRTERWSKHQTSPGNGFLHLPLTGQSRLFLGGKYEVNEIVNFPIQTTAGNTLLMLQAALLPHLPPSWHMTLNVYDAVYFDLPSCDVPSLLSLISHHASTLPYWQHLCDHTGNSIPLTFSHKIKS